MKKNLFNQKGISRALLAVIIAAVLIFAAGGFYMLNRAATRPTSSGSVAAPQKSESKPESMSESPSTIADVVGKGQSLECDFILPSSTGAPSPFGTGKLYTTGSKGRSELTGNTSGMSMEANAIYKEGTAYSWVKVGETTIG